MKMELSIVIPVYKAETFVDKLIHELLSHLKEITNKFEIILVEDGSPDDTWNKIVNCCKIDQRIKGFKLSRNFGQHNAIMAGLTVSSGDWIVVMDCDLQDKPNQIKKMYDKALTGYDAVLAQRFYRADSFMKRLSSKFFYSVFSYFTDTKQDSSIANFGVYSKSLVDGLLSMGDGVKFFPTMINWVGFKKTALRIEHGNRIEGKSSYTFLKLVNLALDNIVSFSDKPLWLVIKLGFVMSILSFSVGIYYVFKFFYMGIPVIGYTSLIVSIWFLSGIMIFILGLLGVYVGKTFAQTKNRPTFIIEKIIN